MPKKKGKKKAILIRIAQRRGERQKRREEVKAKAKKSAFETSQRLREQSEKAFHDSLYLAEREEFRDLHFDPNLLTQYLRDVEQREINDRMIFLQEGIDAVMNLPFAEKAKNLLRTFIETNHERDELQGSVTSARYVLAWLEKGLPPSKIPFFLFLFIQDVKDHPLGTSGQVWKLIQPFLPSRIVTSEEKSLITLPSDSMNRTPIEEKEEEERDKRFPHIILPK